MFGICNLAIVPIRFEASDRSEMVSQLLFGDHFKIVESTPKWIRIQTAFDHYEGWIDRKQYQALSETQFQLIETTANILNGDLIDFVSYGNNQLMPIPLGSSVSFLDINEINTSNFQFEGMKLCGVKPKEQLLKTAFLYLNAPYLWGGKTPFGIDCSGFVQKALKEKFNLTLPRSTGEQARIGKPIKKSELQMGDLVFFKTGRTNHVGIYIEDGKFMHASTKIGVTISELESDYFAKNYWKAQRVFK